MRHAAVAATALLCALGAQQPPSAAGVTEPGRTLARPLDVVLGGASREAQERTVILLLDPSAGLAGAGFAAALETALSTNAALLAKTKVGVGVVGEKNSIVLEPTLEHGKVLTTVTQRLNTPAADFQNVYADVRKALGTFGGAGERILLLVTLENGDVEDDVEQTVILAQRAKARIEVITSEATLADCYWANRQHQEKPRGTTLTGADGAVIDLPWGFLFQWPAANESTPAGYAMWGLTRLAAATEGRVFLYAAPTQTAHECAPINSRCLFCNGDHLPEDAAWNHALVAQLAPSASSRDDTYAALGRDPSFRAMVATWRAAAEAGLISSQPGIKVGTTSASPERARSGRDLGLTDTASFDRNAKRAEQAAEKAEQLRDQLARQLEDIPPEATSMRALAAARYTVVMLQLTRVNLLLYAAWCRETAPAWFEARGQELPAPEIPPIDDDRRPSGVGTSHFCLCHGVKPFLAIELPGGDTVRGELARLDALFTSYQLRYGKSPFGYALRRNGIATFWPAFPGIAGKPPRQRPKTGDNPGPVTPRRPTREGGSSGTPTGPTTGGGG